MTTLTSPVAATSQPTEIPEPDAHQASRPSVWLERVAKLAILMIALGIVAVALSVGVHETAIGWLWSSSWGRPLLVAGGAYGGVSLVWTFWRLWLALRYRPCPTVDDAELPTITIIVPAFNEGPLVARTLRHLAEADYPAERAEIIVVDDGSTDDTWSHIQREAERIGTRVTALHFKRNRGKRFALWEGFRRGTGDIFVTVDSDSLIDPDALKALVSPLVREARVGAVAGNVRVLNGQAGLIPRMLGVRYVLTFDYKRAAQSMMGGGAVMCVAGALAAYRKAAVLPVLDRWLHQTHLGGRARAGEDHAMTNFILGQGHDVRYQRTARVRTQSPTTYAGLAKMFLRWARSNVRETVHMSRFVFTRFRGGRLSGIRANFLMVASGLLVPYLFLAVALGLAVWWPAVFGLKLLAVCATGSSFAFVFFLARERRSDAVFAIPYAFYVTLLMGWIWPYALLTSHKSVWLTREASVGRRRPQAPRRGRSPA